MRTCSVEGCNEKHEAKGLCRKHYNKEYFKNKTNNKNQPKCSIEGCNNNVIKKGMCNKHYQVVAYSLENKRRWSNNFYHTKKGKESKKKHNIKRRARKQNVSVENFSPIEIFERDNYICCVCGLPIDPSLRRPNKLSVSLEHFIPLSKGGNHSRENCSASHIICNMRKGAKLISGNFEGASI